MATLAIIWNAKTGKVTVSGIDANGKVREAKFECVTDVGIEEINVGAQTNFSVLPPVKVQEVL